MRFVIPVYFEEQREQSGHHSIFVARPLFLEKPVRRAERIHRAMTRLTADIRAELNRLARQSDQRELVPWTHFPDMEDRWHEFKVVLKRSTRIFRCLLVTYTTLERRVAFTPSLPSLVFEVEKGVALEDRALEVFTRYFRNQETHPQSESWIDESSRLRGGWLTSIELDIPVKPTPLQKPKHAFASVSGEEALSGEDELRRVGRCLDWWYPDELDRTLLRENELKELSQSLDAEDPRPVLLVGPPKVGKTALIHEMVYRNVHHRKQRYSSQKNVWWISPQRLISGMSYVGQWENRLLAILGEVRKKNHLLYVDDLPGLFQAGISRDANLNVAQVMKPLLEKREFRFIAEITPESLRILRELDRGFADLFAILPLRETSEAETLRIMIHVRKHLEKQRSCTMDLEVLPAVLELQKRHAPDQAFPGKAAGFLRRLAVKYRHGVIQRAQVLEEFQTRSGFALSFLDQQRRLTQAEILQGLETTLVGQPQALRAFADVIAIAKARLNDGDRPLGSFLFLGPTGVGKTQCAKALAQYLFGDSSRLLRFDMNEYLEPSSVTRLIGSFQEPEGLLTSAIRRQPFAVVLLDEIEKAHPNVFDLLISVLGEGRLTDAVGRTVSFSNAILVLTSNLGVKDARSKMGFGAGKEDPGQVYVEAAEKFFRPEFFNRIDRIIPFYSLAPKSIETIAQHLIQQLFERDGFRQRKCRLELHPGVLQRLVRLGYQPLMGARALKRVIEKEVARPVAARLTELPPGAPTLVRMYPKGEEVGIHIEEFVVLDPKRNTPKSRRSPSVLREGLKKVRSCLQRLTEEMEPYRPSGPISLDELSEPQAQYFALREQFGHCENLLRDLQERLEEDPIPSLLDAGERSRFVGRRKLFRVYHAHGYKHLLAAQDLRERLQEISRHPESFGDRLEDLLEEILHELSLLEAMIGHGGTSQSSILLVWSPLTAIGSGTVKKLHQTYNQCLSQIWGLECKELKLVGKSNWIGTHPIAASVVRGFNPSALLGTEMGTHMILTSGGHFYPLQVVVWPVEPFADPLTRVRIAFEERSHWMKSLTAGFVEPHTDPMKFLPVIRLYDERGKTVDLRTGLLTESWPQPAELRAMILSQLKPPQEFRTRSKIAQSLS